MMNKWNLTLGIIVALLLAAVLVVQLTGVSLARAASSASEASARQIMVVGEGNVSVPPDLANVSLGVQFVAPTVTEATQKSNDTMAAVIATLKGLGIADTDIQTSNYNIYPQQDFQNGKPGEITGYQVSNIVQVTVRDLTKLGTVLDQATLAGANNVLDVGFGVDDPAKAQLQAYDKAIADAQALADELARSSGVQRGNLLSISQVEGTNPVPITEAVVGTAGGGTPIQSGNIEFRVNVQMIYEIQ